ncbi:hypothetical protein JTE90_009211 [Oedothorax gibbosus]|uniref:Uncharacterized protein n=1 Tax=Oedothorax gibbosus TaxID=931172 RepID=A0AAV6UXG6_9ARAC|nr:hypothetical protein JTE90_009211 [Oedothorax gibbosus]
MAIEYKRREVPSDGHASVLEFAFESRGCTGIQRRAGEGHTRDLDFSVEPSGYTPVPEKCRRRGTSVSWNSPSNQAGEPAYREEEQGRDTCVLDFVFVSSGYFVSSGCTRHPQQRHRSDVPLALWGSPPSVLHPGRNDCSQCA